VFNPGITTKGDDIVMVYRAVGADGISRFGMATSPDGVNFTRRDLPLFEARLDDPAGRLGIEDPRITTIDGRHLLTYTKVSVDTADTPPLAWETAPFRLRSMVATTGDFKSIAEISAVLEDLNTKDLVLFPERVAGEYVALIREYPSIQITRSADLVNWSKPVPILEPLPGTWEAERVGSGPPPVRTEDGWLVLYHANEYLRFPGNRRMYRMGAALLEIDRPERVLCRLPNPVFEPQEPYEVLGPVGNVVFGTGLLDRGQDWWMYYGAGDGVIGVATVDKSNLLSVLTE
jgi:predicted GH43/DUF377 family glycosyl hydrolase